MINFFLGLRVRSSKGTYRTSEIKEGSEVFISELLLACDVNGSILSCGCLNHFRVVRICFVLFELCPESLERLPPRVFHVTDVRKR